MRKLNLLIILTLVLTMFSVDLFSQETTTEEEKSDFSVNIGLVNRFYWRGIYLDTKPNIQPSFLYAKDGFIGGAWGSFNVTGGYAQTNFFAQYTTFGFTLQLMDHYIWDDTSSVNYFNYKTKETAHLFEASLQYTFKGVRVLGSTFFYGADLDLNNENRYSSYAELGYNFTKKNVTYDFFAGATLNEGIYTDDIAIVNVGLKASKKINFNKTFSLPVSFTIASNPDKEKIHFILELNF